MKNIFPAMLMAPWILLACAAPESAPAPDQVPIPEPVVEEIQVLAADDQRLELLVVNGDPVIREEGFFEGKKRLQLERAQRSLEIFETYGLPTAARVGSEAASDYWILVQHADELVELQVQVLEAIQAAPGGGYDPTELAYLTDRVRINTGRPQVFGSQVTSDTDTARVYPKALENSEEIDERRSEAGMEPLLTYINEMCEAHFAMNRKFYREKGIVAPYRYPQGFTDWE